MQPDALAMRLLLLGGLQQAGLRFSCTITAAEVQQSISNVHFLQIHDLQLGEVTWSWTATARTELEQGKTVSPLRKVLQQS